MSAKICTVGDVMLGENFYHYNRGIVAKFDGRYSELIDLKVKKQIFRDIDVFIFNLECSLHGNEKTKASSLDNSVYVAPHSSLDVFEEIDCIKIANLANNHFGQHGTELCEATISALQEVNIACTGIDNNPVKVDLNKKVILVWGVSLVEDQLYCKTYFKSTYLNLLNDLVLPLKNTVDYWVISIHWGNEYHSKPSLSQCKLARELSDAGFDLIIGHHPHVVQPVEVIKNTIVYYSHGNFIFDQNFSSETQKGLISITDIESKASEIFYSFQKNYRVWRAIKVAKFVHNEKCYKRKDILAPFFMRILMKVELIKNFHQVDIQTVKELLKRFSRKLKF